MKILKAFFLILVFASILVAILYKYGAIQNHPTLKDVNTVANAIANAVDATKKYNFGSIKIEKVWTNADFGYAQVAYTNDSQNTFDQGITIDCQALDAGHKKISSNRRSFFAHEYGLIRPGFTERTQIPVKLYGLKMKFINCDVYGQ